jgi:hypothetical protein
MSEQQPETAPEPGNVIGVLSVVADAEVIPGPETLAKQAAAAADEPTE